MAFTTRVLFILAAEQHLAMGWWFGQSEDRFTDDRTDPQDPHYSTPHPRFGPESSPWARRDHLLDEWLDQHPDATDEEIMRFDGTDTITTPPVWLKRFQDGCEAYDCFMSDWSEWSVGFRNRYIVNEPNTCGWPCPALFWESRPDESIHNCVEALNYFHVQLLGAPVGNCNHEIVDPADDDIIGSWSCSYEDWQDWEGPTKCEGVNWRQRDVSQESWGGTRCAGPLFEAHVEPDSHNDVYGTISRNNRAADKCAKAMTYFLTAIRAKGDYHHRCNFRLIEDRRLTQEIENANGHCPPHLTKPATLPPAGTRLWENTKSLNSNTGLLRLSVVPLCGLIFLVGFVACTRSKSAWKLRTRASENVTEIGGLE